MRAKEQERVTFRARLLTRVLREEFSKVLLQKPSELSHTEQSFMFPLQAVFCGVRWVT